MDYLTTYFSYTRVKIVDNQITQQPTQITFIQQWKWRVYASLIGIIIIVFLLFILPLIVFPIVAATGWVGFEISLGYGSIAPLLSPIILALAFFIGYKKDTKNKNIIATTDNTTNISYPFSIELFGFLFGTWMGSYLGSDIADILTSTSNDINTQFDRLNNFSYILVPIIIVFIYVGFKFFQLLWSLRKRTYQVRNFLLFYILTCILIPLSCYAVYSEYRLSLKQTNTINSTNKIFNEIMVTNYQESAPVAVQVPYPIGDRFYGRTYGTTQLTITADLYIPQSGTYWIGTSFDKNSIDPLVDGTTGIKGLNFDSEYQLIKGTHKLSIVYINETCPSEDITPTFASEPTTRDIQIEVANEDGSINREIHHNSKLYLDQNLELECSSVIQPAQARE